MTETTRTTACPSCGAVVRPDAPWCTLCYHDLRPKPAPMGAPPTVAPVTAAYGLPSGDPLTQPLVDFLPVAPAGPPPVATGLATWPCLTCETVNPISEDRCTVCQQPFLGAMRQSDKPLLVLPYVGDLGAMSRAKRIGVAFGAVAIVLVPLALITLLLTHRPPKDVPVKQVPGQSQTVNQPAPDQGTTTGGTGTGTGSAPATGVAPPEGIPGSTSVN